MNLLTLVRKSGNYGIRLVQLACLHYMNLLTKFMHFKHHNFLQLSQNFSFPPDINSFIIQDKVPLLVLNGWLPWTEASHQFLICGVKRNYFRAVQYIQRKLTVENSTKQWYHLKSSISILLLNPSTCVSVSTAQSFTNKQIFWNLYRLHRCKIFSNMYHLLSMLEI